MNPADVREAQATACLEAAEKYREPLLALGRGLAGSDEGGRELFQQAVLNCHDAIQSRGFAGEAYQFYLRRAIKNLYYRTEKEARRYVPIPFNDPELAEEHEYHWQVADRLRPIEKLLQPAAPEPAHDSHDVLAAQVMAEMQARFSPADRVAFRLQLDGFSCQQIAEHIGTKDQSWVWRRLKRMKAELRAAFGQAWANLGE
jgi:DNA-directed RNA polymerase specialized sigma24 family protein